MPRLNHRKTRTGCLLCKQRKVKCDEGKPRCKDCVRHNRTCEYPQLPQRSSTPRPAAARTTHGSINGHAQLDPDATPSTTLVDDPLLELRLMHEWTAYTCKTFSTAWDFWCYRAPLIALDARYALDAMLAMTALYASRTPPSQRYSSSGRMGVFSDPAPEQPAEQDLGDRWAVKRRASVADRIANVASDFGDASDNELEASQRSAKLLTAHRMYFDRAIEGYRKALSDLNIENVEAVFTASILVSFNALFTLSENQEDNPLQSLDPSFWLRLAGGSRWISRRWHDMAGNAWLAKAGMLHGTPDLSDQDALFAPENGRPFEKLLHFAADFEAMTPEDVEAYKLTLYYIGAIYKGIVEGTDSPFATCRRLSAMSSCCPERFVDLVEARLPRAMVMLAHVFASMKLVDQNAVWFRGIAERQVPIIYEQLPNAWKEMMVWPMAVARGEVDREPLETQRDDSVPH